ncbi:MAG: hypothetical protein DHS20C09_07730 [marine bacterium B5-7]|nr:MAG: hypothetical protein DHS20C09_07730 [marine bacterium B5-7]
MIKLLEEKEANETVRMVYRDIRDSVHMVPNLFKAMAAIDTVWLELNWYRSKQIMIEKGPLDRKTRELIAYAISVTNSCKYCAQTHEKMALMQEATQKELNHAKQIIELVASFNAIENTFPNIPFEN